MSRTKLSALALTLSITALGVASNQGYAQGTLADKALTQLIGKWVSAQKGRAISFMIRDGNAIFQDEVEPNVTLTGAYRQDDSGAGYVLRYSQGMICRYNVNVIGSDGDEISLRTVSSFTGEGGRFRCLDGTLKRTRQN